MLDEKNAFNSAIQQKNYKLAEGEHTSIAEEGSGKLSARLLLYETEDGTEENEIMCDVPQTVWGHWNIMYDGFLKLQQTKKVEHFCR